MVEETPDITQKVVRLNLDESRYGTIAEIGAGQEVAGLFFRTGGAAGTVAKTMSAYDMQVSDAIYGKSARYVSRDRLDSMLEHEYLLLLERLRASRGKTSSFFVYANTVSALNYRKTNICHGWMGIRFQTAPESEPHEILVHVNLLDSTNALQQQAVGILGVNLIYAACYLYDSPSRLIASLNDGLDLERVEIDFIELRGDLFKRFDRTHTSLLLLENKVTKAVAFDGQGAPIPAIDLFYKCPVVIERGTFISADEIYEVLLREAVSAFGREGFDIQRPPQAIFELSADSAITDGELEEEEIQRRMAALARFERPIVVTSYAEYYHLTNFLRRFTKEPVRFATGIATIAQLMDTRFYQHLPGGIVDGLGRLLAADVRIYVYPMEAGRLRKHLLLSTVDLNNWDLPVSGKVSLDNLRIVGPLRHLYNYLYEIGSFKSIGNSSPS